MANTEKLPPPTELEKWDAVRVLEDPSNEQVSNLWLEANRIFLEASK